MLGLPCFHHVSRSGESDRHRVKAGLNSSIRPVQMGGFVEIPTDNLRSFVPRRSNISQQSRQALPPSLGCFLDSLLGRLDGFVITVLDTEDLKGLVRLVAKMDTAHHNSFHTITFWQNNFNTQTNSRDLTEGETRKNRALPAGVVSPGKRYLE